MFLAEGSYNGGSVGAKALEAPSAPRPNHKPKPSQNTRPFFGGSVGVLEITSHNPYGTVPEGRLTVTDAYTPPHQNSV